MYLEQNFDLKTRLIYKALSVNQTDSNNDAFKEYKDIYNYDENYQFFLCINKEVSIHRYSTCE